MRRPLLFSALFLSSISVMLPAQRGGAAATNPTGAMDSGPINTRSTAAPMRGSGADSSVGRSVASSRPIFRTVTVQPVAGTPFTASIITQWKHFLSDGSSDTVKSRQLLVRDSSGRVFQEWRILAANGDKKDTPLIGGEYIDPAHKTHYRCTAGQRQECVSMPYTDASTTSDPTAKSLGTKKIDGYETTGSRQTIALGASKDAPRESVERWSSTQLQLSLMEKHAIDDDFDFSVKDIKLAEPDPKLFALPAGFTIVNQAQ